MTRKLKNIYHLLVAIIANVIFLFPGKRLTVVGVTGTDGKTTTVSLIYHILAENGFRASMVTSIAAKIDGKDFDTGFHRTTPNVITLQKLIRKAASSGSKYLVLEVTSHAIDQNRIWGIPFKIGVLTNVTNEHLDYHKTYENYVNTKAKLLSNAQVAVANLDDKSFPFLLKIKENKKDNFLTYGFSNVATINPSSYPVVGEAIGEFNKYNYLAAIGACKALGLSKEQIEKGIKTFKMPKGRMDFVYEKDFSVLIDFAHTPNAFDKLLGDLRIKTKGRIIHVFGSAGERDRDKRPLMGQASSKYSDVIILTAEDPRSENVGDIISQIEKGITKGEVIKELDRFKAIKRAIGMAQKGDLVVLTGKSHEKSMSYGKKELPWDEYGAVKEALTK